jgi:hypothetical protein
LLEFVLADPQVELRARRPKPPRDSRFVSSAERCRRDARAMRNLDVEDAEAVEQFLASPRSTALRGSRFVTAITRMFAFRSRFPPSHISDRRRRMVRTSSTSVIVRRRSTEIAISASTIGGVFVGSRTTVILASALPRQCRARRSPARLGRVKGRRLQRWSPERGGIKHRSGGE